MGTPRGVSNVFVDEMSEEERRKKEGRGKK
jgi:hypothetical protein